MKKYYSLLLALIGFGISGFSISVCSCGYMTRSSLPGTLIGAVLTWYALFIGKDVKAIKRVVIGFACIITTLFLLKNIGDVLFWGHGA